jgi:poly-gamma-glutamate synthesis protein (capsule biosynthesis protein)
MKKWYRFFVDAGANAVIGHHTHIISGYEVYQEAPIFYSLGNFCFDWPGLRNKPWNNGMMVRLQIEKHQPITFELEYFNQNNEQPGVFLLSDEEKSTAMQSVDQLNGIIADDLLLEQRFANYVASWKPVMDTWIQPYQGKYLPSLFKRGLLPQLITKKKKLLYTNLIRCEAHRDILINTINPTK